MILEVDFDSQKDVVRSLRAPDAEYPDRVKGPEEAGRSVGDTKKESIAALLDKTI